jgi:multicomponent Na+:H+ antiporter subunit A
MRRQLVARGFSLARWGPARLYDWAMDSMFAVAQEQTRVLQSGRLRYYLLTIVVSTVGIVGAAMVRTATYPRQANFAGIHPHDVVLVLVILISILAAVRSGSRLAAIAALGVVGISVALIFALFGAPDVAITLVAAEILTVILLLLILYHLPDFSDLSTRTERLRDSAVAIATGSLMAVLVLVAPAARRVPGISTYFVENSYPLAHGRNVVNVILTDFRSLDTLGEITVLAVAGGGVYALLRLRIGRGGRA